MYLHNLFLNFDEFMNYKTAPNFGAFSFNNMNQINNYSQRNQNNKWNHNNKRESNRGNKKINQNQMLKSNFNDFINNYNPSNQINNMLLNNERTMKDNSSSLKYPFMNEQNDNKFAMNFSENQNLKNNQNFLMNLDEKEKLISGKMEINQSKNNYFPHEQKMQNPQQKYMEKNLGNILMQNPNSGNGYDYNDLKLISNAENLLREQNGCRFIQEKINYSPIIFTDKNEEIIDENTIELREALSEDSDLALMYESFMNREIYADYNLDSEREQEVDLFLNPEDSMLVGK